MAGLCHSLYFVQRAVFAHGAKRNPMGTAYAVWTGIGAVGTFVVGIVAFGDAASIMRMVSAGLIIAGVIGLKFA